MELICPVCECQYSLKRNYATSHDSGRRIGGRCYDRSQGQREPCVGRLMRPEEYLTAEWHTDRVLGLIERNGRILKETNALLMGLHDGQVH